MPFQQAPVFDRVDAVDGPAFAADHPLIADPSTLDMLLTRLNAGTLILATPALMDDIVDPARGARVPLGFQTDGVWIWTQTIAYYLREYGLAPAGRFLEYLMLTAGDPPRAATAEEAAQARAFVLRPREQRETETVWSVG
jgi:hypothetical protein